MEGAGVLPDWDYLIKIQLAGPIGVGKTSLVKKFINDSSDNLNGSIGIDFHIKQIEVDDQKIKLQIWDICGSECFRRGYSNYFNTCACAILLYDVTQEDSFKIADNWIMDINNAVSNNLVKILCGNKIDLTDQRKITTEEGMSKAEENGMHFMEISAKDGTNVNEVLELAVKEIKLRFDEGKPIKGVKVKDSIKLKSNEKKESSKCY